MFLQSGTNSNHEQENMRSTVGIALRCFLFCGKVEGKTAPGFGIAFGGIMDIAKAGGTIKKKRSGGYESWNGI